MIGNPPPAFHPEKPASHRRLPAWLLLLSSGSVLLVLALLPQASHPDNNLVPVVRTARLTRTVLSAPQPVHHPAFRYFLVQVVGNVLAFVPIGASLGVLLDRGRVGDSLVRALAASALMSLCIELVQLALPSRATDVDDLLLNVLGAAIGSLFAVSWLHRSNR